MKNKSTLFLKVLIVLMGLGVAGFGFIVIPEEMIGENIGWAWAIIAAIYISMIPFFFALYQTWKLLSFIDTHQAFSQLSVKALRNIKFSGLAFSAVYLLLLPILFFIAQVEDAPGVAAIGLILTIASGTVATLSAILQRLLEEAINIKSENELTV